MIFFIKISVVQGRELVGYSDLPVPLATEISARLDGQKQFKNTAKALSDGFPLLLRPVTQFRRNDRYMSIDTTFSLPRIADRNAFCTVEYLTPITYRIKKKCFAVLLVMILFLFLV